MSTFSLHGLLHEARAKLHVYKDPDLSDFRIAFNPIFEALDLGTIDNHAKIESIEIDSDLMEAEIYYIYSARGCENGAMMTVPLSVIDDKDPLPAARAYRLKQKHEEFKSSIKTAEKALERAQREYREFLVENNLKHTD